MRKSATNLPLGKRPCHAGRGMLQHVIARSAATWQSVTPAAGHDRKQYFGRIRKSATDLPKVVPTCQVSLRGERIATPVCALVRNDKFGRYARGRAVVQCTTSQPRDADCRTSAIQATHPSPWLFRRKSQVLSLSAASPSPGRTGAARFHFALVRNDMQKTGRCLRVQGPPPLSLRGAERRDNPPPQGKTDRRNHCCAGPWKRNLVFAFTAG